MICKPIARIITTFVLIESSLHFLRSAWMVLSTSTDSPTYSFSNSSSSSSYAFYNTSSDRSSSSSDSLYSFYNASPNSTNTLSDDSSTSSYTLNWSSSTSSSSSSCWHNGFLQWLRLKYIPKNRTLIRSDSSPYSWYSFVVTWRVRRFYRRSYNS